MSLLRLHLGLPCIVGALLLMVPRRCPADFFPFLDPLQPPRIIGVMAHCDDDGPASETIEAALTRGLEDGLEWADVPLQLTADQHHVLWFEPDLRDGTNRKIAERTLAELKAPGGQGTLATRPPGKRLLTLQEGLRLAKGRMNLRLQGQAIAPEQLVRDVLEAGMEHQVVVFDSIANLLRVQRIAQGRLALMAKWHSQIDPLPWVRSNHLAAVEIDVADLTPDIVRQFHTLGLRVAVNVLGPWDQPKDWDFAMAAGADWLHTSLPEEALARALWQHVRNRPVQFSLHRGAMRYAPENTLPAFEKAVRLGADFVEFDVRTTSDGKFYLLHDATLDNETDGNGPIAETPSAVIEQLSAGVRFGAPFANVRLPSLDQFLACVQGRVNLYFDAKAISPEALAAAVGRYDMVERTIVYQSVPYLVRLKQIDPRIRALPPLGSPDQLAAIAERLQPYAVDVDWPVLSKELIDRCHALGIQVFSDALGDHEQVEDYLQAMDWGIDLIQTDHPMKLLRAIELHVARAR